MIDRIDWYPFGVLQLDLFLCIVQWRGSGNVWCCDSQLIIPKPLNYSSQTQSFGSSAVSTINRT